MSALYVPNYVEDERLRAIVEERERRGIDIFDEVWEGVYRMSPGPHALHQRTEYWLAGLVGDQARRYGLGDVFGQVNLRHPGTSLTGPEADFRIPDVVLVPRALVAAVERSGCVEDGATLVIEVRSPREEFLEKLAFYAARKVKEALYIDRTTLEPTLFRRRNGDFAVVKAGRGGWHVVKTAHLRVRRVAVRGEAPRLDVVDAKGGGPLSPL